MEPRRPFERLSVCSMDLATRTGHWALRTQSRKVVYEMISIRARKFAYRESSFESREKSLTFGNTAHGQPSKKAMRTRKKSQYSGQSSKNISSKRTQKRILSSIYLPMSPKPRAPTIIRSTRSSSASSTSFDLASPLRTRICAVTWSTRIAYVVRNFPSHKNTRAHTQNDRYLRL